MVVLEQCKIDYEGKCLIIEATVENLSYFEDVYIESIIIDTNDTYSPNGASNSPIFTKEYTGVKKVRLSISAKELGMSNLNNNIFFVYITTTGIPTPDTPCGMDTCYTMGAAVNLRPIYNMVMKYVKELDSTCEMPKGFIDAILKLKAFDVSLRTGNYPTAFKYWNKLLSNNTNVTYKTNCGCNGIN